MLSQLKKYGKPDILVPLRTDDAEKSKEKILWLYEKFGITRVCLDGLSKGYRAEGYPAREEYMKEAKIFAEVREFAAERGISCGWFCNLTVKSGPGFSPIVRRDGSAHPFANCPLDESFSETLSADMAAYAAVARPAFIFVEDDFSLGAANGCFCERHLDAFAKRMGKRYEREELLSSMEGEAPEALAISRAWQALKKDTLVLLAARIREKMDESCSEIPIGLMQSGAVDVDGAFTEEVARALAGKSHTPFVRLYGTFYCGFENKKLPMTMYHPLYYTEHLPEDILCYHESDTYPHNRFYTSGRQVGALLGAAYSYGMVGSIHFAQQYFDKPFEEEAYGRLLSAERPRLAALSRIAEKCRPYGVELCYDPFYNGGSAPYFAECIGRFGIPFSSREASVAFLDARQAKHFSHEELMRYLSKGLILDGEAAEILTARGYEKYLGVSVSENILNSRPQLTWDLGALEVIKEKYATPDEGREMWCAHCYCPHGNGEWKTVRIIDAGTETVTEGIDFRGNLIMPTMTYFENELGGKILVMSLTVRDNPSQAIYNHRRQRLISRFISRMADEYPLVLGAPDVYLIAMKPREEGELLFALTLINLCEDDAEHVRLHLPESLLRAKRFFALAEDGSEKELAFSYIDGGIELACALPPLAPTYIILKN